MANRNFLSQRVFSGHAMPVEIDCNFIVAAADAGGLGITNLNGPYVTNVFMNTSQTAGTGNNGLVNPNPAAGLILVQLQDPFAKLLSWTYGISTVAGTPATIASAITAGVAYIITTVGNAVAADWATIGLPPGVTPAIGASFIALTTGTGNTTTSRVAPIAAAGSSVLHMEMVGDSNKTCAPNPSSNQGYGSQIILQCRKDSASDASVVATPVDTTLITLKFLMSNSSVSISGG